MIASASIAAEEMRALIGLGVALGIGLLFGVERGWRATLKQDGSRHAAGVRTYGLIGLLGGTTGILATRLEPEIFGWVFAALALIFLTAYALSLRGGDDTGTTSLVAALLAFSLGTLATLDMIPTAVISAVVASLLLGFKPQLHAWVENLDRTELQATLKLLLLALVILPILPNRDLGPGGIVNPYALWWLVVLIAGISYVGYFAVKVLGPDKGIPITSFLGGLASSTATTVRLAKLASRQSPDLHLITAGVLIANATLAPRVLAICAAIDTELALRLTLPLLAMSALIGLPALGFWLRRERLQDVAELQVDNPLALGLALRFAVLLTLVAVLTAIARETFGDTGLLTVASIAGLLDVNAITLSVGRTAAASGADRIIASALVLAILSNAVFKSGLCGLSGSVGLALRVGPPLTLSAGAALAMLWLLPDMPWMSGSAS